LVARAGHTPREAIEKAVGLLGREHVFGVVLNGVDGLNRIYSGYYSGYYRQSAKSISEGAATQGKMTVLTPDIQTTYSKNGSR